MMVAEYPVDIWMAIGNYYSEDETRIIGERFYIYESKRSASGVVPEGLPIGGHRTGGVNCDTTFTSTNC